MNKFKIIAFLFSVLLITSLSSCSKDKDAEPTRKALLTAQVWQGNRVLIDGTDITSYIDMENTSMTFNANGTYIIKFNGDDDNGTWEFTSAEQKLLVDKGTSAETTIDILKLTKESLNLKWTETDDDNGEEYTVELQLIHD